MTIGSSHVPCDSLFGGLKGGPTPPPPAPTALPPIPDGLLSFWTFTLPPESSSLLSSRMIIGPPVGPAGERIRTSSMSLSESSDSPSDDKSRMWCAAASDPWRNLVFPPD